jgi:hypothetical protein
MLNNQTNLREKHNQRRWKSRTYCSEKGKDKNFNLDNL